MKGGLWPMWLRRLTDVAAIVLVAWALWRLLLAPRFLAGPGVSMPASTLTALSGQNYRLPARPSRIVFLDFWATWCEPCRLSLPLVERFARAHPEATVLAIDVGEDAEVVSAYARAHGVQHVLLDARGTTAANFGVLAFPTIVVIDPHGDVRGKWPGFNPAVGLAMANAERVLAPRPAASAP